MRKFALLLASIGLVCAVALGPTSSPAQAASSYDNFLQTTNSLVLRYNSSTLDITDEYLGYVAGDYGCQNSGAYAALTEAMEEGSWAVRAYMNNGPYDVVHIAFFDSTNYHVEIRNTPGSMYQTDLYDGTGNQVIGHGYIDLRYNGSTVVCSTTYGTADNVSFTGFWGIGDSAGIWYNGYTYLNTLEVQYPSGYEGTLLPGPTMPAYVAMGDSFSSGEGNAPFETGTDSSLNSCHRSSEAYPRLLADEFNFDSVAFVACSGATTQTVIDGKNDEPSQLYWLSEDTEVVTITIGGNDIKFVDFATACVVSSCEDDSAEYAESWGIMTDSSSDDYLPDRLESLFSGIADGLTATNSSVEVYVIGYPYVITEDSKANASSSVCTYMSLEEAAAAEAVVAKLDEVIADSVTNFGDSRFEYVDPNDVGSPFRWHELCTSDGYFYGIDAYFVDGAYVFHPNTDGQQAYFDVIEAYVE